MKKQYIHCIISLFILSIGIISCMIALAFENLLATTKSSFVVFGICFILIGIVSYIQHHHKYLKIKHLKNKEVPVIASWRFEPHHSKYIDEMLYTQKSSTVSTIFLTFLLGTIIAACIFLSGEAYSTSIGMSLLLLSITALILALIYSNYYYTYKSNTLCEIIIGKDCIYFLDELYTLHKSIYFLENIIIHHSSETTLQFLYGDYDLFTGPRYTLIIPIPEGQLKQAEYIQKHYLRLIQDTCV